MFLRERDRSYLKERFEREMKDEVKITLYTRGLDCEYCSETEQLMKELSQISDKLKLEIYNVFLDAEKIPEKVDRVPMITVGNNRIKFLGIPAGYEFSVLIEDIIELSRGEPLLSKSSIEKIKKIDRPIKIKVFVTPTCPYCPRMVKYAHSAALVNPNIEAEMIEATEFPDIANRYSVYGVPKTVINDIVEIEGAVPEEHFVEELVRAYNLTL